MTLRVVDFVLSRTTTTFAKIKFDPEIQQKIEQYSKEKQLQLMMQLWEEDFRREMQILHYAFKHKTEQELHNWLQKEAQKQTKPPGATWWIDAAGNLHED